MPSKKTEVSEPKSRNAVLTRQRILEAAVAQFAEEGFAKASIDRIVDAVGLTKGAVYHHFKDKSQLFEAAFLAVEDRFSERLPAGRGAGGASRAGLGTVDAARGGLLPWRRHRLAGRAVRGGCRR